MKHAIVIDQSLTSHFNNGCRKRRDTPGFGRLRFRFTMADDTTVRGAIINSSHHPWVNTPGRVATGFSRHPVLYVKLARRLGTGGWETTHRGAFDKSKRRVVHDQHGPIPLELAVGEATKPRQEFGAGHYSGIQSTRQKRSP